MHIKTIFYLYLCLFIFQQTTQNLFHNNFHNNSYYNFYYNYYYNSHNNSSQQFITTILPSSAKVSQNTLFYPRKLKTFQTAILQRKFITIKSSLFCMLIENGAFKELQINFKIHPLLKKGRNRNAHFRV